MNKNIKKEKKQMESKPMDSKRYAEAIYDIVKKMSEANVERVYKFIRYLYAYKG